jgi:hypothetical protein
VADVHAARNGCRCQRPCNASLAARRAASRRLRGSCCAAGARAVQLTVHATSRRVRAPAVLPCQGASLQWQWQLRASVCVRLTACCVLPVQAVQRAPFPPAARQSCAQPWQQPTAPATARPAAAAACPASRKPRAWVSGAAAVLRPEAAAPRRRTMRLHLPRLPAAGFGSAATSAAAPLVRRVLVTWLPDAPLRSCSRGSRLSSHRFLWFRITCRPLSCVCSRGPAGPGFLRGGGGGRAPRLARMGAAQAAAGGATGAGGTRQWHWRRRQRQPPD